LLLLSQLVATIVFCVKFAKNKIENKIFCSLFFPPLLPPPFFMLIFLKSVNFFLFSLVSLLIYFFIVVLVSSNHYFLCEILQKQIEMRKFCCIFFYFSRENIIRFHKTKIGISIKTIVTFPLWFLICSNFYLDLKPSLYVYR
jgi:hypothetical protein